MHVSADTRTVTKIVNLQHASPVQTEDENGKSSAVQSETDPVEVNEQVSCQLLAMQHAESRWVCVKTACQYDVLGHVYLEGFSR